MAPPRACRPCTDSGSIVLGWLTRLTLILVLLGIIGFEVLSVVVTRVSLEDIGATAGHRALDDYRSNHNVDGAFHIASAEAELQGATLPRKSFEITDESVTFRLEKLAPTLVLYRVDQTAGWAHVETTVYAEPIEVGGQVP